MFKEITVEIIQPNINQVVSKQNKVIVELFPNNQSKESFESAEFSQVYDLFELAPCCLKAYDNINHDIARMNAHVVIGIDRAGLVGEDGETHQGILDLSLAVKTKNSVCCDVIINDKIKKIKTNDEPISSTKP